MGRPEGTDRLLPQAPDVGVKGYQGDTHRLIDPAATVARVRRVAPAMGITRLANVTGLDTLGIPVVMAVRPNARSLAVSQGKGLTLDAAKASALMESVEGYHAEHILAPLKHASYEEMRYRHRVVDVDRLPRLDNSRFHPDLRLLWIEGHDLIAEAPTWVPFEMVHTDYTLPQPTGSGCFPGTSNGLASGNHVLEATSHALSEVIERDATTLWTYGGKRAAGRRVRLETVDDPGCRQVLAAYARAGIEVGVWETTSDVALPAFLCTIVPGPGAERDLYANSGMGCHPRREVALLRALTEAAQSRLTLISGSRDDNTSQRYGHLLDAGTLHEERARLSYDEPVVDFAGAPNWEYDTFAGDVAAEVAQLVAVGIEQAVVVDLSHPELSLPVVRVVVPGLEGVHDVPGYVLGQRGRSALANQEAVA